jgi:hypothetical protein
MGCEILKRGSLSIFEHFLHKKRLKRCENLFNLFMFFIERNDWQLIDYQ